MIQLCSLFGFIVLHMLLYAANIYYWRRYRVNYAFIFGFKPGTELGYRQVLLVGFGIGTLALVCVLSNLDMKMHPKTMDYETFTELLPLILLLVCPKLSNSPTQSNPNLIESVYLTVFYWFAPQVLVIILFLPFNILYRSSRVFFLTCLFHCICAPLYKVKLMAPDL